jgi:hypothetical protein
VSAYPLGRKGPVIGTPHTGTHTLGNWQSDNALDIGVPVGTPVYAVADGTIGSNIGSLGAAAGSRFAGLRVQLNGAGNSWWYGHLSKLAVRAGQQVKAGQLLGYSGSANGVAHLHISQQNGDPHAILTGGAITGTAKVRDPGSGVEGALNTVLAAPFNDPGQAPTVTDIPGEIAQIPAKIVSAVADALGHEGARVLLWITFVFGGVGLAVLGISRATGLKPTDLTLNPAALAGKVAAARG